jgi:serine/threonine-protein kinase
MSTQTLQLPQEGEKVGSGILLSLISTGGSAYVYKTWVDSLEMHRAVKVMSPDAENDVRERFQTEARINSKLLNPYIVQCFNFGITSGGLPFLEMEYLSGPSLSAVIQKRGALPLPVALALSIGALEGLSYAHAIKYTLYNKQHEGLIHRDLKPANLVIASDGNVKLMDFGIARPVDTSLHTLAGTVPGTVAYMSPEACSGGDCDFRSDIYQLGLCLYEFISGLPVFPQSDLSSLLEAKTANKYQPLESIAKDTDRRALAIVRKCLQLDPAERFQSAHACLLEIRALYNIISPSMPPNQLILSFLDNKPVSATHLNSKSHKYLKTASLSILILVLVGLAGLAFSHYGLRAYSKFKQFQAAVVSSPPPAISTDSISIPAPVIQPAQPAPVPPTVKPSAKRSSVPAVVRPIPASRQQEISPEDALFFIEQGKGFYSNGSFSEAFTSFQTALRMPSQKSRQEIVRSCVYWSAKCNTALFKQSKVPASNYTASWQSVLNTFPSNTPEYMEAATQLQGAAE